jgi:hypothetical protein
MKRKCQIVNYIPHLETNGSSFRDWFKYYLYDLNALFSIHNEVIYSRYGIDVEDYDVEFKKFVTFMYQNSSRFIPEY